MRREHEVFGDARFEHLAHLSNGHPYNLRKSRTYRRKRTAWTRTKPSAVAIGERRRAPRQGGARPAVRRHRPRLAGRGVGIRMRDDRSALAPLRQRFERLFNASGSLPSRHVP